VLLALSRRIYNGFVLWLRDSSAVDLVLLFFRSVRSRCVELLGRHRSLVLYMELAIVDQSGQLWLRMLSLLVGSKLYRLVSVVLLGGHPTL